MKNDKKLQCAELALEPVKVGEPGRDAFKSMTLDELLASLALILEFEAIHNEIYGTQPMGSPTKYLH